MQSSQDHTRVRSSAMAITTKAKQRFTTELNNLDHLNEEEKEEKLTQYIEEKIAINKKTEQTEVKDKLNFPVPNFLDVPKEGLSKPVFSENARIVSLGSRDYTQNLNTKVDFKTLINQFNESNIQEFEIQDLLDFDFESIGETKEKINELMDRTTIIVNSCLNGSESNGESEMLVFLCNKLNVSICYLVFY